MTLSVWNKIFVGTWSTFVQDQTAHQQKYGWSNVTAGWDNTGLGAIGGVANSKNWKHASSSLGLKHDLGAGTRGGSDEPLNETETGATAVVRAELGRKALHQRAIAAAMVPTTFKIRAAPPVVVNLLKTKMIESQF